MSRAFVCLVAVVTLAWARPAPAQPRPAQPARDTPATVAGGTAIVRGRVVEAATGRGLSRVQVRVNTNNPTSGTPPPVPYPWQAMTDADGRYEINGVPSGTYAIVASKTNYVRGAWGETRVEGPGKRIPLTDGQVLEKIDLRLVRAGVITGKILDEFGDPVTDVQVIPMRYQFQQGRRQLTPAGRSGQTNDIGEYRIYGLSPGQYYVSATLRNISMGTDTGSDRSGYAATFFPGTGNVAEAQRLTIAPGQTMNGINVTLLPIQTSRVSGIALDSEGRPLPNTMVMAMQRFGYTGFAGPAQTRADGKFTINGLTPGEYTIRLNLPGTQEQAAANVVVDGSDVTGLQLVATKPSTIRGRVTFEAGGKPPLPSAIRITAMRTEVAMNGGGNAVVKDDLTFEMPLQAGRVFVRSPPTGQDWRLNRVFLNGDDVTDTGIEVPPGGSMDIVVELTNHLYPLSGTVTDENGAVVRDCWVIVFGQDPAGWTPGMRHLASVRPGLDDLYHAKMPAGEYYAVAFGEVEGGAWTDPEFLSRAREHATKFTLAAGETKAVNLPLSPTPVF